MTRRRNEQHASDEAAAAQELQAREPHLLPLARPTKHSCHTVRPERLRITSFCLPCLTPILTFLAIAPRRAAPTLTQAVIRALYERLEASGASERFAAVHIGAVRRLTRRVRLPTVALLFSAKCAAAARCFCLLSGAACA